MVFAEGHLRIRCEKKGKKKQTLGFVFKNGSPFLIQKRGSNHRVSFPLVFCDKSLSFSTQRTENLWIW